MSSSVLGFMLRNCFSKTLIHQHTNGWQVVLSSFCPVQNDSIRTYAARKGTRMKQEQKKKSRETEIQEKKPWIPQKMLLAQSQKIKVKKRSEMGKRLKEVAIDNVYWTVYYKWPVHEFGEAVKQQQETHHPTMYNEPNALLKVVLELDLKLKKKNRFVEDFTSLVRLPHDFELVAPRKVLVICKRPEEVEQGKAAGAHILGGTELVKMIQTGEISTDDFDYVVSTPDLLPELVPIRGVLKKRFPSRAKGSLGFEIGKMVDALSKGVEYSTTHDEHEHEYGTAEIIIGRLSMKIEHLEENIDAAIKELCTHRSSELGPFVTRAFLVSPPSTEKLYICHEKYLPAAQGEGEEEDDDDHEKVVLP